MSKKKTIKKLPLWQKLMGFYLLCMFAVFPVFCTDGYFNIRHDRYYFFLYASLVTLSLCGVFRLMGGGAEKELPQNLQAVHARRDGPWYRQLSVTDWSAVIFVLLAAVSTVLSRYPMDAILGTMGRNNGLILLVVYSGVYFLISRWNVHRGYICLALAIASGFVSLIAILNYFGWDPLNMLEKLSLKDQRIFISTMGNKNFLSSYFCMTVPATTVLFVQCRTKWEQAVYLTCSVLGFSGLMCADSDSGFLGMGAFCLLGLIIFLREPGKLKKLMLALTLMLLTAKLIFCPAELFGMESRGMGALQRTLLHSFGSWIAMALMVPATALLYLLHQWDPRLRLPVALPVVLLAAGVAGIGVVTVGMVYYTVIEPDVPLEGMWQLLRLDDQWGTNRGFIWRKSLEILRDFSWKDKLLGSGPDTFYGVFQPYFRELAQYGDSSTNAAHNEYLHYLITQGILGLGAYLTWIIASVVKALRRTQKEPYVWVWLSGVVGYTAQAVVNIAQPITTPIFIIFLALAAGTAPKKISKKPYVPKRK